MSESILIGRKKLELEVEEDGRRVVNEQAALLIEQVLGSPLERRAELKPAVSLAVGAFHACVCRVGANLEKGEYVVKNDTGEWSWSTKWGALVFDSVIRSCLRHMGHALLLLLNPLEKDKVGHLRSVDIFPLFRYETRSGKASIGLSSNTSTGSSR